MMNPFRFCLGLGLGCDLIMSIWSGRGASHSVAGQIPPGLVGASRAVWFDADRSGLMVCSVLTQDQWECLGASERPQGLVVIISDSGVAAIPVGLAGASLAIRRWGRLLVVTPGGVASEDLVGAQLTLWAPERSPFRTRVNRFNPVRGSGVDVLRIAEGTFWIAGDIFDPDAYLTIDHSRVAATLIPLSMLTDGPPDIPAFVAASAAWSLSGFVQTASGAAVEGAYVELFQPLPRHADTAASAPMTAPGGLEVQPMVRRATARSTADGGFLFEHLPLPPFLISAIDSTEGRGTALVTAAGDTAIVRLTRPSRATGRVLRHGVPVPSARVRFVPTATAMLESADPRELLAEEQMAGADGRFVLSLPPSRAGMLQVIGPDGASARVPLAAKGEASLGDISLPEHRRLTVRLIDSNSCKLWTIGPLGALGLTIVDATAAADVHWFDIPEPGQWLLSAECHGKTYSVAPAVVEIPDSGSELTVDVRLVK